MRTLLPPETTNNIRRYSAVLFSVLVFLARQNSAQQNSWVNLSDAAFAQQYAKEATSPDLTAQSTVAWMLFARINQPQSLNGQTFSQWEVWPSNEDIFSPAVSAFVAANKVRTRPHLQEPKTALIRGKHLEGATGLPSGAGEEVTHNLVSYQYIKTNGMTTAVGVWRRLKSGENLNFPLGAVDIKAFWAIGATNGAYQITDSTENPPVVYSLLGIHIMAKVAPTPSDPFFSPDPSWFWTTFEFKGNPGLANAQQFLTYHDALSRDQSMALLKQAGLEAGPFANYVCDGTQIHYADATNPSIRLGNTTMENFSFTPPDAPSPAQWTSWEISCHSCHGTGSANGRGNRPPGNLLWNLYFSDVIGTNGAVVGVLPRDFAAGGYKPFDFVWSFFRAR